MAPSYPAGIAVVKGSDGDELLVAENLADDVVLLNAADGKVLRRFDLSRGSLVPSQFPYTCVANRAGTRGWCSLWNGSAVAELDLQSGKVVRQTELRGAAGSIEASSSHPTALLLSSDEKWLFAALSNRDAVAMIATASGRVNHYFDTRMSREIRRKLSQRVGRVAGSKRSVCCECVSGCRGGLSDSGSEYSHIGRIGRGST